MQEQGYGFGNLKVSEFTGKLASKDPVPGGGGAAALCGALAAALSGMVASLTLGKKKYVSVQPEMEKLIGDARTLQSDLLDLIDHDAEAFEPLSRAYSLPRSTEEEKTRRAEIMEKALLEAALSPLGIMEKAAQAAPLIRMAAADGSRLAVSDAGCAAAILVSSLKAAALNVYVNTRLMTDREQAERLNRRTEQILSGCLPDMEKIYSFVCADLALKKQ